jgi:large subunit ribosomal protein L14
MVCAGTRLYVIDNSGAKVVECIRILGTNSRFGFAGDIAIVTVKQVNPLKKIKKGQILRAVISLTKKSKARKNGIVVSFGLNCAVIVNNKNVPLGTRILGPVMLELREKGLMKVVSMATLAI